MEPQRDGQTSRTDIEKSEYSISRRAAFQRVGSGIAGTALLSGGLLQAVDIVRADHGDASFIDSEYDIFNSDYTQHIATKLENTNSGYSSGDDMYFHRFVVVGDCATTWSNDYSNK